MKRTPLVLLIFCALIYFCVYHYNQWEERRAIAKQAQIYALANKLLAEQGKPPLPTPPPAADAKPAPPAPAEKASTMVRQSDGTLKQVEATTPTPPIEPEDPKSSSGKVYTTPTAADLVGKTPPANPEPPNLSQNTVGEHKDYKGLTFEKMSKQSSFRLTPDTGKDYYWYTSDGEGEEMGWLNVKGIQGVIVQTDGPAIFEVITRKAGGKAIIERFKKDYGNATKYCPWDEKNKKWLSAVPFNLIDHTKGILEQIRVLKDKEDLSPIMIEVGIPQK